MHIEPDTTCADDSGEHMDAMSGAIALYTAALVLRTMFPCDDVEADYLVSRAEELERAAHPGAVE